MTPPLPFVVIFCLNYFVQFLPDCFISNMRICVISRMRISFYLIYLPILKITSIIIAIYFFIDDDIDNHVHMKNIAEISIMIF